MIAYMLNAETKAAVVAALVEHGADPRMSGALGRVRREESPLAVSGLIAAWPPAPDGMFDITLSNTAGIICWRAYATAEIAAGRGHLADLDGYCERFNTTMTEAYDYVCAQMKGSGIRPCSTAEHNCWTDSTDWVLADGKTPDPRARWASSTWRGRAVAHEAYARAGLVVAGRGTWNPIATILFVTPEPEMSSSTLAPADEIALTRIQRRCISCPA